MLHLTRSRDGYWDKGAKVWEVGYLPNLNYSNSSKMFINYKGVNRNFIVEKPGRHPY